MFNLETPMTLSTHAPRAAASRLTQYRLKAAAVARDAAIDAAHDQYAMQVRAIGSRDRPSTLALRAGEKANALAWPWKQCPATTDPALSHPFASAFDRE